MSGDGITRWPADGADLLDDIETFLRRFVSYPSGAACVAHALWIAHAHLMDAWESTPRIAFLSPEPGSGKTRALEVTELLVPRAVESINATPAYIFRKIADEEGPPTLLWDEIDTVFGPKARDNEEIRGVLNAGHRRGAVAGRCVVRGKAIETEELPAYCAVALAGLGDLPDTILSRSVIVRMRKRAPGEAVEPFRRRVELQPAGVLRGRLEAWAEQVRPTVTGVYPEMPDGIEDRDADVWEALLAVADAAGGAWPERARVSAVSLVSDTKAATPSLGVLLLADLRAVFGDAHVMSTESILKALHALEESPWSDLRGSPLNPRGLAQRLRQYGVRSKQVRIGEVTLKGYALEDLHDAWSRYLPPVGRPPMGHETEETEETSVVDDDDLGRWEAMARNGVRPRCRTCELPTGEQSHPGEPVCRCSGSRSEAAGEAAVPAGAERSSSSEHGPDAWAQRMRLTPRRDGDA